VKLNVGRSAPPDPELGKDGRIALGDLRSRSYEEGSQLKVLGELELGRDGRHRQAAGSVRIAQANDVEEELLLSCGLYSLVVLDSALVEGRGTEA
jgi:hypothetical protein